MSSLLNKIGNLAAYLMYSALESREPEEAPLALVEEEGDPIPFIELPNDIIFPMNGIDFIKPDDEVVRERAWKLWDAAGRPEGKSEEFWYLAELYAKQEIWTRIWLGDLDLDGEDVVEVKVDYTGWPSDCCCCGEKSGKCQVC